VKKATMAKCMLHFKYFEKIAKNLKSYSLGEIYKTTKDYFYCILHDFTY